MAYSSLNVRWTKKSSDRCHERILQFLRANRAPIQTIELRFSTSETEPVRQWEIDRNPIELIDEILRFVAVRGDDVAMTVTVRDGLPSER